ncbi:MAG: phosphoenolpyruvate carboxylase [Thermoanaerobaculia bacterium]|nr:phosphoenolpyruvate carboxylase [Thermoanaerobaculia bacterium]
MTRPSGTADRGADFREQDLPLKEDVSLLGQLVGEVICEQGGADLFELVEACRRAAIDRREADEGSDAVAEQDPTAETLLELVQELAPRRAELLVRSFLAYFQVVNLAEQIHRIRRRRAYLRDQVIQRHSLLDFVEQLKAEGLGLAEVRDLLAGVRFEPVFTAHPTEATRRTILEKELRIARMLVRRFDTSLTPPEAEAALARIRDEVTTAWQTEEHPFVRPAVADEMDHVLYHITDVVYRVIPPFYESLADALLRVYGDDASDLDPGELITCASWVGGDMDGNPYVSASTVRSTLAEHRRRIVECYRNEVARLARQLSQCESRVGVDEAVHERLSEYRERFVDEFDRVPERHRDMPYRVLLRLIRHRLSLAASDGGYSASEGLLDDLRRIDRSLGRHRGDHAGRFALQRLIRRVRTFGFHLATLDLRQDAAVHRQVLAELLEDPAWPERSAAERLERLVAELPTAAQRKDVAAGSLAERAIDVLDAVREAREQDLGPGAIGPFIVSMTEGADDVLAVLLLARWAGLDTATLDVAPLFETVEDLVAAPQILDRLLSLPFYRDHVAARGDRQVVMIGYSDSNKDGGLAAARWALHTAQSAMTDTLARHGVQPVIFHGRGGTISRGGGKTDRAVLSSPRGTVAGRLRVTEQGEVINARYGLRGIALRTLERAVGSVCLATAREGLPTHGADSREPGWHRIMDTVATTSRRAYRDLVWRHPDFYRYFREATPIDVIERMMIGSRPASRRSKEGIENLRAIPWVFSWTQSRHVLPGWYGLGDGLGAAIGEHGETAVAEMVSGWPFVASLLEDVEMVLAKSDLDIARRYAELAGSVGAEVFPRIREEMERTKRWILQLQGREILLEADPVLRRSIRLRNPYVDPMSLLQIDLLRRWRATDRQDEELLHALLASVHGIAQGLRNTG